MTQVGSHFGKNRRETEELKLKETVLKGEKINPVTFLGH